MRNHNTPSQKPNRNGRIMRLTLAAGLAIAGCAEDSSSAKQAPDTQVTVDLPPVTTESITTTSVETTTTVNQHEALKKQTEQDMLSLESVIKDITSSGDLNIQQASSEGVDNKIYESAVKFVPNEDGTLSRYYTGITYGGDSAYEEVQGVFIAKDIVQLPLTDETSYTYGFDFSVNYIRRPDNDWRIVTCKEGEENATFYTTEPLRGAVNENIVPLTADMGTKQTGNALIILDEMQHLEGVLPVTGSTIDHI